MGICRAATAGRRPRKRVNAASLAPCRKAANMPSNAALLVDKAFAPLPIHAVANRPVRMLVRVDGDACRPRPRMRDISRSCMRRRLLDEHEQALRTRARRDCAGRRLLRRLALNRKWCIMSPSAPGMRGNLSPTWPLSRASHHQRIFYRRAIYLAPALLLTALAVSPASAAPAAVVDGAASPIVLAQVYHRGGDNDHRYDRDHRRAPPRYVAGRRYGSAPHG
jgi:hypothetical protein